MIQEFKDFIARGNVMDLAVGIIMGTAFTAIVTSIVDDLVNPLIGLVIGGIDFGSLKIMVGDAAFNYGNFINAVIKFMIIAWVIFLLVKGVNKMRDAAVKKQAAPAAPAGPSELDVLMQIRDALKK